ncbi:MAG: cytochrome c-type biogenesis CcmF C-terminal domain-containing protein [Myxococcota bacterium]|nr:cytochrome c-type biogenesis CcmF C-terminal domain-containing protein [Myxococcota bacterium]
MTNDHRVVRAARYGVYACVFLYAAMAGVLWHGYFTHDFANKYIQTYSDVEMPPIYLFTSFWGGEKGALLFWATMLCIFGAIAIHQARDRSPDYLGWAAGIIMLAVFFYDILMVFESNPFELFRSQDAPEDGQGLNPLLQNPTMAIHPPSLLTGYIAFTIPFAFGASSLITNRLDVQWAKDTRKWTLVSWIFLTTGLILGGAWAYQELGWGGFWMWDPVENAGLIPWFTATAFLHSIVIQERRGMLKRWNFSLVCLTFFLTIFGTFLTRSQLIVSIHAFADSQLAEYFLWYLLVLAMLSFALLAWRWKALEPDERIDSFLSREAFFVLNNVMLVMCAFIVLWGTLYSKISGSVGFQDMYNGIVSAFSSLGIQAEELHQQQDLGEPWFNKVMTPAGVILLFLTAVGPLIPWRRTTWKSLNKTFVKPFVVSSGIMGLGTVALIYRRASVYAETVRGGLVDGYNLWVLTIEPGDIWAFFTIWFAIFVFTGVTFEFMLGGRVRQRRRGGSLAGNVWSLTVKAKRRYGGYIVHIGVALAFLGFAGAAFKQTAPETPLHFGESLKVGEYQATFTRMSDTYHHGKGYVATVADLVVMEGPETVPMSEVDRVLEYVRSKGYTPVHAETKPGSPKIILRFKSAEHRSRFREELYLTTTMQERFKQLPRSANDAPRTLSFTFLDQLMVQVSPPLIHRHIDEVRRTLGSLYAGAAVVSSTKGQPKFTVRWKTDEDFARAQALLRQQTASLDGVLMARVNPTEDTLEIITAGTGKLLKPEVRRYKKHSSPTTEVAIWSRMSEDVYFAMRPGFGQPFISLLGFVNPMINLLWLGAVVMFFGGVFIIFPTGGLKARAARRVRQNAGTASTTAALLLGLLSALTLVAPSAEAATRHTTDVLGAMKCACDDSGERVFDEKQTLINCPCSLGQSVKRRVEDFLASQSEQRLDTLEPQFEFFESFMLQDRSNERYLRFDEAAFSSLMENTKCTCGCGKMALSQCPLDCPWNPRVQRFWKVALALGMDRDAARDYYLAQANRVHRGEDDPLITLDSIILNQEKPLSWGVPVTLGLVTLVGILSGLALRMRKRPAPATAEPPMAAATDDTSHEQSLAGVDRELIQDELDELGL